MQIETCRGAAARAAKRAANAAEARARAEAQLAEAVAKERETATELQAKRDELRTPGALFPATQREMHGAQKKLRASLWKEVPPCRLQTQSHVGSQPISEKFVCEHAEGSVQPTSVCEIQL